MLAARSYTLLTVSKHIHMIDHEAMTFCEFTARFNCAKSDEGSTVPRNIGLYWFMPALAKRSVGSEWGTTEEEGTVALFSHICWLVCSENSYTE